MFIQDMPEAARARLVTIAYDANLIEAARLLTSGTDIVVVCSGEGMLKGVVTKTDVVKQMSICQGAACLCLVSAVMTSDVVFCQDSDSLQEVSARMKARHLKNIPVVDKDNRPSGLRTARAILRILLNDVEREEDLLVDYVKGVGYR